MVEAVRPARTLRSQARARAQARRMNELDRVVREHVKPEPSPDAYATSGVSQTEIGFRPWMPHDHRPAVGFTPNSMERF